MLVDSSVWINFFNRRESPSVDRLSRALAERPVLLGDLVLVEVLSGFRERLLFRLAGTVFAPLSVVTLCGPDVAPKAAANYRMLRRRGITVRGTIDVIIATWCIENRTALLHDDRDFDVFEGQLGLICAR